LRKVAYITLQQSSRDASTQRKVRILIIPKLSRTG